MSTFASTTSLPQVIIVHVAGAVRKPGLVFLANGSRANDALLAAGGFSDSADINAVNLAMVLNDGDQFFVPSRATRRSNPIPAQRVTREPSSKGTTSSGSGSSGDGAQVNINSATATELDSLPGVGPSTAAAIVAYRTAHGPFETVEGLLAVRGIGEAKLDAMRSQIRV